MVSQRIRISRRQPNSPKSPVADRIRSEVNDSIGKWCQPDTESNGAASQWLADRLPAKNLVQSVDFYQLLAWAVTGRLSPMGFVRRGQEDQYVPAVNILVLFTVRAAANSLSRSVAWKLPMLQHDSFDSMNRIDSDFDPILNINPNCIQRTICRPINSIVDPKSAASVQRSDSMHSTDRSESRQTEHEINRRTF